ncbi:hypothetical protein HII36_02965 [Nonomuraea sp. NN258]|uniref:DUF5955 family protein n=1 Tax=Nonomuraea antri TaxID=2730852 RepID=UPI001568B425|nr:DUF5955 family protein [Nonomuraea antri]NRQ30800.1 hypothetical protein [Nonomuraea antri]
MRDRDDTWPRGESIRIDNLSGQGNNIGGSGNTAYVNMGAPAQLQTLVRQLEAAVAGHRAELADPEGAGDAVELLREEVDGGRPSPKRLTAFLNALTTSAGSVTAVTEAVAKLKDTIGAML